MIGLPTSAPRSYGNQHNLSTPGVANNRTGANVAMTKKPPMMIQGPAQQQQSQQQSQQQQQQHRQIGFAPGGAVPPEQQPMYAGMQPNPYFLRMQEPILPRQQNVAGLNFGKQYHEQAMPLG